MTPFEKRAASALAAIYAFRMLGLFMILPVFALYADGFEGVTPTKIGIAIGAYGLTQALLQIPFGMISDRWGRKPVIVAGLVIFGIGSLIAANATTIDEVIFGRVIQGAGAVASVVMALMADLTREEHRVKAMATIGVSIGFSFLIAMVVGPLLGAWVGISGIFAVTAVLAALGIMVLIFLVPNPTNTHFHRDAEATPTLMSAVLKDSQLLRLDLGIFSLHFVLTANFVVIPFMLRDAGLAVDAHSWFYLPVMVLAMGFMVPFVIIAEKYHKMKLVFLGAIAALLLSELLLIVTGGSIWVMAFIVWLFFTAFNVLEASLPSLVSKFSPATRKGTAMGVYSSSQFIGAFFGGVIGGSVYGSSGSLGVLLVCGGLLLLWMIFAATMKHPRYYMTTLIKMGDVDLTDVTKLESEIAAVSGVKEVTINADENVAYLKVEHKELDVERLALITKHD